MSSTKFLIFSTFFFTYIISALSVYIPQKINIYDKLRINMGDFLIPDNPNSADQNTLLINKKLEEIKSSGGGSLYFPNEIYHVNGGIYADNISNLKFQLDGILKFQNQRSKWPKKNTSTNKINNPIFHLNDLSNLFNFSSLFDNSPVKEAIYFYNCENCIFTSNKIGTLDGNGSKWWGYINYLIYSENRPRLLKIENSENILIENLYFLDSPYWTTLFEDILNLEIRNSTISARRNSKDSHDLYNLGAFNTDGFDVAGKNIYIHNVTVWNQDDSICIKQLGSNGKRAKCSENYLIENIKASGVGLTIGSIGAGGDIPCVRNITFRNGISHNPFKGIYLKSRPSSNGKAIIENILYENITIENPSQWPIWIGPQQAIYKNACMLTWPFIGNCPVPQNVLFENVTLKDITVNYDNTFKNKIRKITPGVILSNSTNPMKGITFDNVKFNGPKIGDYICSETEVLSVNGTWPVPCGKK